MLRTLKRIANAVITLMNGIIPDLGSHLEWGTWHLSCLSGRDDVSIAR